MSWRGVKRGFVGEDDGQDLIEYSLLLAFIVLAGVAVYMGVGSSIGTLWTVANSRLAAANN